MSLYIETMLMFCLFFPLLAKPLTHWFIVSG